MAINKVVLQNADGTADTLIDLTGDTVSPEVLAKGVTAHGADGEVIVGEGEGHVSVNLDENGDIFVSGKGGLINNNNNTEEYHKIWEYIRETTDDPVTSLEEEINLKDYKEFIIYTSCGGEAVGRIGLSIILPLYGNGYRSASGIRDFNMGAWSSQWFQVKILEILPSGKYIAIDNSKAVPLYWQGSSTYIDGGVKFSAPENTTAKFEIRIYAK